MANSKNDISRKDAVRLIAESSLYGNLGLFIGSGMSKAILCDEWTGPTALSWKELMYKCAEEFNIDLKKDIEIDGMSYPEIATQIALLICENEDVSYEIAVKRLKDKIADLTCWYPNNEDRVKYGKLIEEIDPKWIITTNYDLLIECLLTGKGASLGPNDQLVASKDMIPIYHLHGIRTNPDSIIVTQEDYTSLFRPNQYRQQRLPLLIKESTTLLIGYSLGDVNVLTSVDWAKNVYNEQRITYPNEIIQLLYKKGKYKKTPYKDRNNILIVEYNDLATILGELIEEIEELKKSKAEEVENEEAIHSMIINPDDKIINDFIDNSEFREGVISVTIYSNRLVSGFLVLLSKAYEETWERASPSGAFYAYKENLVLSLDVLEQVSFNDIPPALLELIAYNLDKVGFYIGNSKGESWEAHNTWEARKGNIPLNTLKELKSIAYSHNFYRLKNLLKKIE